MTTGMPRETTLPPSNGSIPMALSALCSIVLGIVFAACPTSLRAQAPPGPIHPGASSDSPSSSSSDPSSTPVLRRRDQPSAPAKVQVAPRQDIGGEWRLNLNDSDDGRKKLAEAERSRSDNGPYGGPGGNGPYGGPGSNGPWGGGPTIGGYPFPGSGGPYGGNSGGGRNGRDESDSPALREYVAPPLNITFALKEGEADLTDDDGNKRIFCTDGRKIQKSKDTTTKEIEAHWEGSRLVSQGKDPLGGQIRRTFELSQDNRQMDEYVTMEVDRSRTIMIHYVYDIVPGK